MTWHTAIVARIKVMRIIARMNVGGPAVQIAGLMRGLPESEFDQRLFTGFCDPEEADYLNSQAPDVLAVRIPGLGRSLRPSEDLKALLSLMREMRHFRPDIIHTHTTKAGVLGRAAGQLSGINPLMVHTYHGHLLHGYFSPPKTQALVALEKFSARSTTKLVAVGRRVRDDLLNAGIGRPSQFTVIPPGLPPLVVPSQRVARKVLKVPEETQIIGLIGRLTHIKRPDTFAKTVSIIAQSSPSTHFVVAGSGDLYREMRNFTKDLPVTMLGWRNDIQTVLGACDAVLLTSDNEGTPLSLIQAGMAGLPVIASDVGSVRDVVIDGETGWLAKPNPSDLSVAVLDFLNNPLEAKRRGLAARAHTRELFSLERFLRDHTNLYRNLVQEPFGA